jgi:hypothetical protein
MPSARSSSGVVAYECTADEMSSVCHDAYVLA